jgi:SGNH hydrolase-like domain, acetyltransferase AlgX
MKRIVARVPLLMLGLLMPLVLLEIGLRICFPEVPVRRFDPVYGGLPRPNLHTRTTYGGYEAVVVVRTDASGLRQDPTLPKPRPDAIRILALGDSFTFGDELEAPDSWPSQLERVLDRGRPGGSYVVINGGVSDFGTAQELLQYRRLSGQIRPNLVILAFFVGNDILDNLCLEDGTLTPRNDSPCYVFRSNGLVLQPPKPIAEADAVAVLGRLRVIQFLTFQARRATVWNSHFLHAAAWLGIRIPAIRHEGFVESWYDERYFDPGWHLTQRLLTTLGNEVKDKQARLLVLIIPDAMQVDPQLRQSRSLLGGDDRAMQAFLEDSTRPQRLIMAFCRDQQLPWIDVLPQLEAEQRRGKKLYFPINRHWTPLSDHIAAQLIAREIGQYLTPG